MKLSSYRLAIRLPASGNRRVACLFAMCALGMSACGTGTVAAPTAAPTAVVASSATPAAAPTAAPVAAATQTVAPPTATVASTTDSFAPKKRAVWDTTASPDDVQGDCPGGSVVPPYGPVLITPNASGFEWKDVQNAVYSFTSAPAGFAYAGPNARNDGVITMTLTFENAQAFKMRALYVKTAEPACTHAFDYLGAFKFER